MSALLLTEGDVAGLVSVTDAIAALQTAFQEQSDGLAFTNPRSRLRVRGAMLHMMAAAVLGYFGYKAYTVAGGKARFYFHLFSSDSGELLSVMEADRLGQIRTGAASGLATSLLARKDARTLTLFGAGWQAETQLLAVAAVRPLERVFVINRNPQNRERFIERMSRQAGIPFADAAAPEEAVRSSDIVTTITSAKTPVLEGRWLNSGTHVNAAGSNFIVKRELDDEAVLRAGSVVVDSIEQARIECGEFLPLIESGRRHWDDFAELKDVVAGFRGRRRSPDEITLFKSLGLALEDIALGRLAYERALSRGIGRKLDL